MDIQQLMGLPADKPIKIMISPKNNKIKKWN